MSSKFARKLYDNLPSLDLAVQIWWHNNLSCPNSKKHLNVSVKKRKWFQDINIYNSMVFTMMSLIYGPALTRVQFILCFPSLFGILISNAISAFHCSLPLYENELLITLYLCLEINKYELSVLLLLQWTCCCWLGCCWSLRRGEVGILWQRWVSWRWSESVSGEHWWQLLMLLATSLSTFDTFAASLMQCPWTCLK